MIDHAVGSDLSFVEAEYVAGCLAASNQIHFSISKPFSLIYNAWALISAFAIWNFAAAIPCATAIATLSIDSQFFVEIAAFFRIIRDVVINCFVTHVLV